MSVAGSQQQTYLRLLTALQPHWRNDVALPARIQATLAQNKQFGSRDRRLYRELLYTTVRYLPWLEPLLPADATQVAKIVAWLAPDTRETHAYRAELCGDWPDATTVAERAAFLQQDAAALLPAWFKPECPGVFEPPELEAQLARAPLWLRLQTDDSSAIATEFSERGWAWAASAILPTAWRLRDEVDVTKSDAYARGAIEIQDLGSQLLLETVDIAPGGRWLDACAGAGGKTLQLARRVGRGGHVDAFDIRPGALDELMARQQRAHKAPGAELAPVHVLRAAPPAVGAYDGVLVDAPCSGSGTWRRAPHLKWSTSPKLVVNRAAVQTELLSRYAAHVRPGGTLIYATCSLARRENEGVIAAFTAEHRGFELVPPARDFGYASSAQGLTLMPARHDTDGFFVSVLRRR